MEANETFEEWHINILYFILFPPPGNPKQFEVTKHFRKIQTLSLL